jgi:methyl-accepting chemotaxis protein
MDNWFLSFKRKAMKGESKEIKGIKGFNSMKMKLLALFIPIVMVTAISITMLNFWAAKNEVTDVTQKRVNNGLSYIVKQLEGEFDSHKRIAQGIGAFYEVNGTSLEKEDYQKVMEEMVPINQHTLGAGIWLEPYTYDKELKYFGPYVYKDGSSLVYTEDYETDEYDYPNTDWYKAGKEAEAGTAAWTEPYYDETTGITMITAAVPIYQNEELAGVVTADYDLSSIQQIIAEETFEQSGYLFMSL